MNNKGFSLIEVSIVVLVVSVIAASSLSLLGKKNSADNRKETRDRLEYIARAIQVYFNDKGYLPCPAKFNSEIAPADPGINDILIGEAIPAGCVSSGMAGIANSQAYDSSNISGGAVPYIDLGIEPDSMFDEWGRRIVYMVDADLTVNSADFNSSTAHIEVRSPLEYAVTRKPRANEINTEVEDCTDETGATRKEVTDYSVEIPVCMAYALISQGPNGQWGVKANGQSYVDNETNYGSYEIENAVITLLNGATYFDDTIVKMPVNLVYDPDPPQGEFGYFDDIVIYREKEYLQNVNSGD